MDKRIKDVMSSIFNIDAASIVNETSPDTVESWDSLKHMSLVVALEEEFSIEFSDSEMLDLVSFENIAEAIKGKL